VRSGSDRRCPQGDGVGVTTTVAGTRRVCTGPEDGRLEGADGGGVVPESAAAVGTVPDGGGGGGAPCDGCTELDGCTSVRIVPLRYIADWHCGGVAEDEAALDGGGVDDGGGAWASTGTPHSSS